MSPIDQSIFIGIIIGWGLHAWVIPHFKRVFMTDHEGSTDPSEFSFISKVPAPNGM